MFGTQYETFQVASLIDKDLPQKVNGLRTTDILNGLKSGSFLPIHDVCNSSPCYNGTHYIEIEILTYQVIPRAACFLGEDSGLKDKENRCHQMNYESKNLPEPVRSELLGASDRFDSVLAYWTRHRERTHDDNFRQSSQNAHLEFGKLKK